MEGKNPYMKYKKDQKSDAVQNTFSEKGKGLILEFLEKPRGGDSYRACTLQNELKADTCRKDLWRKGQR